MQPYPQHRETIVSGGQVVKHMPHQSASAPQFNRVDESAAGYPLSNEDTIPNGISARGDAVFLPPYPVFGGGTANANIEDGYTSKRDNFKKVRNEQELFGAAGSPIMASGEFDGTAGIDKADLADEALAQRVMEEENMRRLERQRQE